jgi:hypothetical protein
MSSIKISQKEQLDEAFFETGKEPYRNCINFLPIHKK